MGLLQQSLVDEVDFNKFPDHLAPVIVQDSLTYQVLSLVYADREALRLTIDTGQAHFFSRSRNEIWLKGATSGNTMKVTQIVADCDSDALIYFVVPHGPACHTGAISCFGCNVKPSENIGWLKHLETIIQERKATGANDSYVASLFASGADRICQKVGEEAIETVIAAKNSDEKAFVNEAADLLFHYLVLLQQKDHGLADIVQILQQRHQTSIKDHS